MISPVIKVPRGCPNAGVGCACMGTCEELIEVVPVHEYWRVVGERDEARRYLPAPSCRACNGTGFIVLIERGRPNRLRPCPECFEASSHCLPGHAPPEHPCDYPDCKCERTA